MNKTFVIDHNNVFAPTTLLDKDPRGVVWLFEPPKPNASYVVGVDPAMGKTGWDRALRTDDDVNTDNSAIEVIRVGQHGKPDVQVAEFAAPIDPYDLAKYVNCLGRLYCGSAEDEQALTIIEIYPGPGFATQRELIEKYGYTNLFVWKYLDSVSPRSTNSLGWTSTPKSVRDLWIKGIRHVCSNAVEMKSKYLVEEWANCKFDTAKQRGMAIGNKKDDRVSAFLMAVWAAHDWTGQIDLEAHTSQVTHGDGKPKNWQAMDLTVEQMEEEWERVWEELEGDD